MKSKEEIEKLADSTINKEGYTTDDFIIGFEQGYTQCQEDMVELLKEEIKRAFIHGQGNAQMMEAGLERDEVEDYTYYRMRTLNKQD
jgi:hypothetical protein